MTLNLPRKSTKRCNLKRKWRAVTTKSPSMKKWNKRWTSLLRVNLKSTSATWRTSRERGRHATKIWAVRKTYETTGMNFSTTVLPIEASWGALSGINVRNPLRIKVANLITRSPDPTHLIRLILTTLTRGLTRSSCTITSSRCKYKELTPLVSRRPIEGGNEPRGRNLTIGSGEVTI